jgi:hypothetical protein
VKACSLLTTNQIASFLAAGNETLVITGGSAPPLVSGVSAHGDDATSCEYFIKKPPGDFSVSYYPKVTKSAFLLHEWDSSAVPSYAWTVAGFSDCSIAWSSDIVGQFGFYKDGTAIILNFSSVHYAGDTTGLRSTVRGLALSVSRSV